MVIYSIIFFPHMIERSLDCRVSIFMQPETFCGHIMLWRYCHCISEKGSTRDQKSEIVHIWQTYLALEIVKYKTRQKNKMQLVKQITVSSVLLCLHFLLIYTCSTFRCWHAAVFSCFALCSPLFHKYMGTAKLLW